MAFYAHKRVEPDGETSRQTVCAHLIGAAQRAGQCLRSVGLENTGYLAGLLHDMGKYTEEFQQYLDSHSSKIYWKFQAIVNSNDESSYENVQKALEECTKYLSEE